MEKRPIRKEDKDRFALALESSGLTVLRGEPLSRHTYYRIGGAADLLLIPRSEEDLKTIARLLADHLVPYFFLGKGSNLLVSDEGFRGLVIKTQELNKTLLEQTGDLITVGAGVPVAVLLRQAMQSGWGGLEFLAGVPGSVGGVVFMNAGTHLGEAAGGLVRVQYFSLSSPEKGIQEVDELPYSYRKNHFLGEGDLVLSSLWKITLGDPADVKTSIKETLERRKNSQPIHLPSCGSVFKNPEGHRAWQVIDGLGLRGHKIGSAQFSEKHSNFIVNLGGAKAEDVRGLIQLAKKRAADEKGIELHEEVRYLGF